MMFKMMTIGLLAACLAAPALAQSTPESRARWERIRADEAAYAARPLKRVWVDTRGYCGGTRIQQDMARRAVANGRKAKTQLEAIGYRVEILELVAGQQVDTFANPDGGKPSPVYRTDRC
jgi:hypothetical protein